MTGKEILVNMCRSEMGLKRIFLWAFLSRIHKRWVFDLNKERLRLLQEHLFIREVTLCQECLLSFERFQLRSLYAVLKVLFSWYHMQYSRCQLLVLSMSSNNLSPFFAFPNLLVISLTLLLLFALLLFLLKVSLVQL